MKGSQNNNTSIEDCIDGHFTHLGGLFSSGSCLPPERIPALFHTHGSVGFTLTPDIEKLFKAMVSDAKFRDQPLLDVLHGTVVPAHKCKWQLTPVRKEKPVSVLADEKEKEKVILKSWVSDNTETYTVPLYNILKNICIVKMSWMCTTMITSYTLKYICKRNDGESEKQYKKRRNTMLSSFCNLLNTFTFFLGTLGFLSCHNCCQNAWEKKYVSRCGRHQKEKRSIRNWATSVGEGCSDKTCT